LLHLGINSFFCSPKVSHQFFDFKFFEIREHLNGYNNLIETWWYDTQKLLDNPRFLDRLFQNLGIYGGNMCARQEGEEKVPGGGGARTPSWRPASRQASGRRAGEKGSY
jgi:hypothetical protein